MENKIYFSNLECYKHASEKIKILIGRNPYFDLNLLPTERMREETAAYIMQRSMEVAVSTLYVDRKQYHHLCRFLQKNRRGAESFNERDKEKWIRQLKGWMMSEGIPVTVKSTNSYGNERFIKSPTISYFEHLLDFTATEKFQDEIEKDIWELEKLEIDILINPIKNFKTLNFTKIIQLDMREEAKKAIYIHLKNEAIASVARELTAMRRLSRFLREKYPDLESCGEIDRNVFEEYLIHLKTEDTRTKHFHSELTRLRAILETIGKVYQYPQLETLVLNRDIPPTPKAEFKAYSDGELKRLNAFLVKLDEQTARLMIIHQMLGTRISDTLTLQSDCLYEKDGTIIIRIKQMKTHVYEKPVSEELAMLIRTAMKYTEEKYGRTKYIFVNDKNPDKPMQYGTIQSKVTRMIHKEDIRDDEGNLFGFGTHMYRHYYGVKLTEMHLDDWTIAKLLGHSSVNNVRYYRKMSNQMLADETRRARHRLSEIILDNLDGWGEEYEQIRQDDSLE